MTTADTDASIRIAPDNYHLHWAALNDCSDLARYLTESFYDVNEHELWQGTTPLFWAAAAGHINVARVLLEKGASAKVADRHGITPLHAAVHGGEPEMARLLIRHGASIYATDADGLTPVDWAKSFERLEFEKIFEGIAYRESGARKRDELARQARHGRAVGE
jgi:ankyrin repeat protein